MPGDKGGLDAARFDPYRPDLSGVESLDLNWGHGMDEEDGRSFGLTYLYSIGDTGHESVAACTIAGLAPEDYPIAVVNEGGYTVDVIASSITTWLPCYLLHKVGGYLLTALYRNTRSWSIPWLDDEVKRLVSEEAALREALSGFGLPPAFDEALTAVFDLLRHNDTLTVSQWRPADLYAMVEPTGYVSAYRRLAASSGTTAADWTGLIRAYPWYNKPLFHQFAEFDWDASAPDAEEYQRFYASSATKVRSIGPTTVPVELAHEVFHRRLAHDADGVSGTDVLERSARLITRAGHQVELPIAPLVHDVAEQGTAEILLGEAYYEAGQRWETFAPDSVSRALVCYENALHQHALETEEWHWAALARVRELAARLGDRHYEYYLRDAPVGEAED